MNENDAKGIEMKKSFSNSEELKYDKVDFLEEKDNKIQSLDIKFQKDDIDNMTSIDGIIDKIGINKYNLRIYIIASLFFLADGSEMIVISLLVTKLGDLWNLSISQKGFIGSSVFLGFFLGAILSGKLADTKGRKPTFIIGAFIVCLFSTLSAFSINYTMLLILRPLNGFGIGISIPSCISLATEVSPKKTRAWVLSLVWIFFPFGEIFAVLIAKYMLQYENGWRFLLGFAAVPTIVAFILSFFIFESPKFYFAVKNYQKGFEQLEKMLQYIKMKKLTEQQKAQLLKKMKK